MEKSWHPFVDESLVEITVSARPRIRGALAALQEEAARREGVLSICYAKSGRRQNTAGAAFSEIGQHVVVGVHDGKDVPEEMIFDLLGYQVAYALNPVFGEEPRPVVIQWSDTFLEVVFEDR